MLDFNAAAEMQLIARDGAALVHFPLEQSHKLKRRIKEMRGAGLVFVAVLLLNHSPSYVYEWRNQLEHRLWLGIDLEMQRRWSVEFERKMDAIVFPARDPLAGVGLAWLDRVALEWPREMKP